MFSITNHQLNIKLIKLVKQKELTKYVIIKRYGY